MTKKDRQQQGKEDTGRYFSDSIEYSINTSLINISDKIGTIYGRLDGMGNSLHNLQGTLDAACITMRDHGQAIAAMQVREEIRGKRLSELCKKLDMTDVTGQHHILEERTRWNTLKFVGSILLGVLTALSILYAIYHQENGCGYYKGQIRGIDAGAKNEARHR